MQYAKALVAVAGALVAAVSLALEDGAWTGQDYVSVSIALLTAVGVYLVPNKTV